MNNKEKFSIYIISMLIYIAIGIYNIIQKSQWIFDIVITIVFITIILAISKKLRLGKFSFIFLNIGILSHLLGSFDFYAWKLGIFEYDTLVHILNSIVAAYIVFNFIKEKIYTKKEQRIAIDKHKVLFLFLVIASVATLGTIIELIEFGGYLYLGPGEGLLFTGYGDSGKLGTAEGQYIDTMSDILVNIIGSIIGALFYYFTSYNQKLLYKLS